MLNNNKDSVNNYSYLEIADVSISLTCKLEKKNVDILFPC